VSCELYPPPSFRLTPPKGDKKSKQLSSLGEGGHSHTLVWEWTEEDYSKTYIQEGNFLAPEFYTFDLILSK
jgi:hypothetical protein